MLEAPGPLRGNGRNGIATGVPTACLCPAGVGTGWLGRCRIEDRAGEVVDIGALGSRKTKSTIRITA